MNQVNDQKTELNTVTETVVSSHLVKLAGFKLPVAPPPPVIATGKVYHKIIFYNASILIQCI